MPQAWIFFEEGQELRAGVVDWVEGEVLLAIHVVIVIPYNIERDPSLLVVLNHVFDHRQVVVAPSALVESYMYQTDNKRTLQTHG